ncbi:hypothetical protein RSOLAG1IB_06966 [Rhizoctonia solani AG-1 IB]|uniref:Uncharacterized protein n=1 Tax=Thanatephorus cucumeris (strain AG1-IB / isolate 7/3/14) TaxID=1108050 RepID=A0A0B7F8C8_THACB|nr:hypothetical protein RSOLAG1IB_06966 [Rhizoctonia solani AG-1 IB]
MDPSIALVEITISANSTDPAPACAIKFKYKLFLIPPNTSRGLANAVFIHQRCELQHLRCGLFRTSGETHAHSIFEVISGIPRGVNSRQQYWEPGRAR